MQKPKVLIADDEIDLREGLAELISDALNVDVTLAEDGQMALKLVKENAFDAIITDINMPKMDGLQFIEAMRELGIHTPVVILTGFPDQEKVIKALRLGAFDFLEKPCRQENIVDVMGRAIEIGVQFNLWGNDSSVTEPIAEIKKANSNRSADQLSQLLRAVVKANKK